jgi:phosphoglycerate dehydrogenase-like enzyme
MDKLRVAFTSIFFRPDGSLAFPGYDISALRSMPNVEIKVLGPAKILQAEAIADVDILVTSTGETKINRTSLGPDGRLTLIARAGAGYDDVDIVACTASHIAVAIATEAVRRPTAVAALTLILAVATRLIPKHLITRNGPRDWERREDFLSMDLAGKTLGLVGLGSIGSELARLAAPLDMRIIAHDPAISAEAAAAVGARLVGFEALLREADIVSLHVPLSAATYHLMGAERLALMKPTALLINTSRGPVIDQAALTQCLKAGRIAGAGLDVTEKEPPDEDDPILGLDNVVLSGHALNWTDTLAARLAETNIRVIRALMEQRDPPGVVNAEVLRSPQWRRRLLRLGALAAGSPGP